MFFQNVIDQVITIETDKFFSWKLARVISRLSSIKGSSLNIYECIGDEVMRCKAFLWREDVLQWIAIRK